MVGDTGFHAQYIIFSIAEKFHQPIFLPPSDKHFELLYTDLCYQISYLFVVAHLCNNTLFATITFFPLKIKMNVNRKDKIERKQRD